MSLLQLQTALVALLPKDGEPRTAQWLAEQTRTTVDDVVHALLTQTLDNRVEYDQFNVLFFIEREAQ